MTRPDVEVMRELPWCDCKVAYGIDDFEKFERWMDRTNDGAGLLPAGWSLCEVDGSGARYVAIFRVENVLCKADGMLVLRLLAKVGGYRPPRAARRSRTASTALIAAEGRADG